MIIASFILLIAMIGAIVLTLLHHHDSSHVRRQDIFGQITSYVAPAGGAPGKPNLSLPLF